MEGKKLSELNHPNEINRDYIRLLQGMSRFIKKEFSVAIRMTQGDAVEQLLHYAAQSENTVLQEMAKELKEFTFGNEAPASPAQTETEGVRYYRGAPVVSESRPGKAAATQRTDAETKNRPARIYRGQVVHS
jgi:hypothetical protein